MRALTHFLTHRLKPNGGNHQQKIEFARSHAATNRRSRALVVKSGRSPRHGRANLGPRGTAHDGRNCADLRQTCCPCRGTQQTKIWRSLVPRPATRWDSSELTDGTHHALVKPLSEGVASHRAHRWQDFFARHYLSSRSSNSTQCSKAHRQCSGATSSTALLCSCALSSLEACNPRALRSTPQIPSGAPFSLVAGVGAQGLKYLICGGTASPDRTGDL